MKDKFVKKNNEFRAAQEAARNNEARLKKEIDEYRNKVATVTETLNANTQKLQLQNEETVTRYDKEIDQLKDHNNKLLNDMDAALRSVPEKLRVDSDKLRTTEATIRANAEAKEKEMLAQLEKQTKDAARDLELQREQYEYWLTLKTEELKTLLAEFQTYKSEKVAQVNTLEKHCMHLFDYCNALATIMANFDKGLYPVYEKTGIKAVNFPDKAKPGPMAADTLRDLTKYKKRADDFIKSHPTNLTATFTESNPTARTGSGAANTEKEELQRYGKRRRPCATRCKQRRSKPPRTWWMCGRRWSSRCSPTLPTTPPSSTSRESRTSAPTTKSSCTRRCGGAKTCGWRWTRSSASSTRP